MKKVVFSLVILSVFCLVLSTVIAPPIQAISSDNALQDMKQFDDQTRRTEQANLAKTTDGVVTNTLNSLAGQVAGCWTCTDGRADGGAIGGVGKMIAFTYSPAASTETYVADLLRNMNLAPQAYAQGIGFSALQPVLALWKIFRDIAYIFFVFIFLIIGFAIMFRKNLGGQTAVTVQQALPRIIIALLAVSFSYAIAGLMVDLMWTLMYFLITMFNTANLIPDSLGGGYNILNQNIFQVFFNIISSDFSGTAGAVIGDLVTSMLSGAGGLNDALAGVVGGVTGVLGTLIIFVAILFAMFRTFFSLIKIYFEIVLMIVFAPIILMMGAINGNAFGNWIKGLVANLMVFPVLLVFVIIGYMFINFTTNNSLPQQFEESGFVPPFIPGRGAADQIGLIGGIAAIMLLPEVVAIVGKFKPSSIFDEFGAKAVQNLQPGWSGGELIPGMKFTRMPGMATAYSDAKRLTVGTEEFRKRQEDLALHGKEPKLGGLMGAVVNPVQSFVTGRRTYASQNRVPQQQFEQRNLFQQGQQVEAQRGPLPYDVTGVVNNSVVDKVNQAKAARTSTTPPNRGPIIE